MLSSEALASVLPSGLKATLLTVPRCPFKVRSSAPESVSQSRTVLSSEALASVLPSGLKATLQTVLWCPFKALRVRSGASVPEPHGLVVGGAGERLAVGAEGHAPDRVSGVLSRLRSVAAGVQRPRAARSCLEALARRLPSGLKATLQTASLVSCQGSAAACRCAASQSRTVLSSEALARRLAVGAEGHAQDPALVSFQGAEAAAPGQRPRAARCCRRAAGEASCRRG